MTALRSGLVSLGGRSGGGRPVQLFPPANNVLAQFELNGNTQDVCRCPPSIRPASTGRHTSRSSSPYTVEMVIIPNDTNCWRKLHSYDDAADAGWYYCSNGFYSYPHGGAGPGLMQAGVRHYIALVSSAPNTLTVYFQGNALGSATTGIGSTPGRSAVFFRDESGTGRNERFNGLVDAVRISNVARSPVEIQAIQQRLLANP